MLERLIDQLKDTGHRNGEFTFHLGDTREGRLRGQVYADLYLKRKEKKRLMRLSFYEGNEPYYKAWIELFSIRPVLRFDHLTFHYFGSEREKTLFDTIGSFLSEGGRIFVEYRSDEETKKELSKGVPEPCTRLGHEFFKRDFTWFKDWYFAEGFYEGSQKLQAEKAIDEEHRKKHLAKIEKDVARLLKKSDVKSKVRERAQDVLDEIEK